MKLKEGITIVISDSISDITNDYY